MKLKFPLIFFVIFSLVTSSFNVFAQNSLAITMDDPNTYETPIMNWQQRNEAILNTLDKHKIKAALFVCGMRVNDSNGITLLKKWDQKKHLICNHSYSHLYFNSKSRSSEQFISDFMKGDSIIKPYKNYTKLFRFPYLKEGNTAVKRDSMRIAMNNFNYKNGYVSIDASDWYIDAEIIKAVKKDSNTDLTPYKLYYINHILDRANYYDSLAQLLFKREIHHTLLIHHSLLNALFLDDLLMALEAHGWKLIDAKTAYKDAVFNEQPKIEPCGESIVWQCAELNESLSKTLRYPAEDEIYEKETFTKFIQNYLLNKN